MKQHSAPPYRARQVLGLAVLIAFSGPALANKALAEKQGCLACHAAATKLVGPAYRDVAAKYTGDATRARFLCRASATVAQASGVRCPCHRRSRSPRPTPRRSRVGSSTARNRHVLPAF